MAFTNFVNSIHEQQNSKRKTITIMQTQIIVITVITVIKNDVETLN